MNKPRHGDPLDYPDIPGDSGLSDEYRDSLRSPEVRAAITKRRVDKIPSEATAGGFNVIMEHDGALYRGPALGFPAEVWSPWRGWRPYAHAGVLKPVDWGSIITEAEALERMLEWAADATGPKHPR